MQNRRDTLKHSLAVASLLGTTGLFPQFAWAFNKSAFEARSVPDALKAYGVTAPAESSAVTLTAPEIAENGAVVSVALATSLPGVRHLLLLVPRNPTTLIAKFDVTDAIEPAFATRIKMSETSDVYAVAVTADGKAHYSKKEVKVTLGGCGA